MGFISYMKAKRMKIVAQRLKGKNGSMLLEASYTVHEVVHCHLILDCGKLKRCNINLRATTKITQALQLLSQSCLNRFMKDSHLT